jgi:hypothetical protein
MAEIVNNDGEIEALLAELQFLRQASQANTYDICRWCVDNHWCGEDAQRMFPKVWHLLEKRIREYPNEAREVDDDGKLPIHIVLDYSRRLRTNTAAPLSLVHLLIEVHPDGLHVLDLVGYIPLHSAVDHSCIDCFRAVLYNGGVEATTIQDSNGWTPLHWSIEPNVSLVTLWELLHFNRDCITIQDVRGRTALEFLEDHNHQYNQHLDRYEYRQNAKIVLLKLAANYNHVPKLPSEGVTAELKSHPACAVLAPRLEPDNDGFILHQALKAKCQLPLLKLLRMSFQIKYNMQILMVSCLCILLYNQILAHRFDSLLPSFWQHCILPIQ